MDAHNHSLICYAGFSGDSREATATTSFSGKKPWDGGSFKMATEDSFDRIQKKMREIQAAVATEAGTPVSFEKMQAQMLEVTAAANRDAATNKDDVGGRDKSVDSTGTVVHLSPSYSGGLPGAKKGHISTSVTFEKMQQKMKEMAYMLSLDSVWNKEDTERVREREREVERQRARDQVAREKENRADGRSVGFTSPKKKVAVRSHSRHRGGATPEVVERRFSPFSRRGECFSAFAA